MKLHTLLAAAALAVSGGLTFTAQAASDTAAATPAQQAPAQQAAAKKKVKPHNHMEEKTGIPAKAPAEQAEAPKPLHSHPRDMK